MAKAPNGILGEFIGKVGPVIGVNYRGQLILKSIPTKSTKKRSEKQLMNQAKFGVMMNFLSPLQTIVNRYFTTSDKTKIGMNIISSYFLKEVISIKNEQFEFAFEKAVFTQGILSPAFIYSKKVDNNNDVILNWHNNTDNGLAQKDDYLMIIGYCVAEGELHLFSNAAERTDTEVLLQMPPNWHSSVHFWTFWVSSCGKFHSTSLYAGTLEL